jgi:serine/threonine protein kinase
MTRDSQLLIRRVISRRFRSHTDDRYLFLRPGASDLLLKFFRSIWPDPQRRERFEREAKVVSLNHPHICTLHDVGEQDRSYYLVMELLEGETLESRGLRKAAFL